MWYCRLGGLGFSQVAVLPLAIAFPRFFSLLAECPAHGPQVCVLKQHALRIPVSVVWEVVLVHTLIF